MNQSAILFAFLSGMVVPTGIEPVLTANLAFEGISLVVLPITLWDLVLVLLDYLWQRYLIKIMNYSFVDDHQHSRKIRPFGNIPVGSVSFDFDVNIMLRKVKIRKVLTLSAFPHISKRVKIVGPLNLQ